MVAGCSVDFGVEAHEIPRRYIEPLDQRATDAADIFHLIFQCCGLLPYACGRTSRIRQSNNITHTACVAEGLDDSNKATFFHTPPLDKPNAQHRRRQTVADYARRETKKV